MTQFTVNTHRSDPYKGFKFRVKWEGRYVAGVNKVRIPKRSVKLAEHREGGDPRTSRKSPGRTNYEAITLEGGMTHDPEFDRWASKIWNSETRAETSLRESRKDIIIDVFNETQQKVMSYRAYRCWVSEYQALPDLDANATAVAIQTIKLENEGWERDTDLTGPTEPRLSEPPEESH